MLLLALCVSQLVGHTFANLLVVDLGNAFWKVALVSPGRFDVLTNQQSKRKTFTGFSLAETRSFGDEALRDFVKKPLQTPANFRWLLGEHDVASLPASRRPPVPYPLGIKNETVSFSDLDLSAEEAVANLLDFAKLLVRENGKSSEGLDLVMTVPVAATLRERQAYVRAGRMAGFKRVSLVSELSAAAVQRGVDLAGSKAANETIADQLGLNLIVNVGASHTEACVFEYASNSTITVGVRGCAGSLVGGAAIDGLLADVMETKFFEKNPKLKATTPGGTLDAKAKLRMFRQAESTKLLLSANKEASFSVESLLEDRDFRVNVKREDFENLIEPVVANILAVVDEVLSKTGVKLVDIKTREVVGGAWRVPKILNAMNAKFGNFGQRLNGEEAAVLGAAFLGASEITTVKLGAKVGLVDTTGSRKYTLRVFSDSTSVGESVVLAEAESKLGVRRVVRVPTKSVFLSGNAATVELFENDLLVETWTLVHADTANAVAVSDQLVLKFDLDTSGLVRLTAAELKLLPSAVEAPASTNATNSTAAATAAATTRPLKVERTREAWEDGVVESGRAKVDKFRISDARVVARLAARNSVEGFVYERRSKLADDVVLKRVADSSQISALSAALDDAEAWLYGEGDQASQIDYEKRLLDLKLQFSPVDRRASELSARDAFGPFVIKAFSELSTGISDLRDKRTWVPAAAVDKLFDDFTAFQTEWQTLSTQQAALQEHDDPVFLVADLKKKLTALVKELRRLLKIPAPLPPTPPSPPANATNSTAAPESGHGHSPTDEL